MVGIQIAGKVGEKGQVVIPKAIRDQFHIKQDTELLFDVKDDNIILRKKRSGLDILDDFITAVEKKKKFPQHIDWDKEYYSQFE